MEKQGRCAKAKDAIAVALLSVFSAFLFTGIIGSGIESTNIQKFSDGKFYSTYFGQAQSRLAICCSAFSFALLFIVAVGFLTQRTAFFLVAFGLLLCVEIALLSIEVQRTNESSINAQRQYFIANFDNDTNISDFFEMHYGCIGLQSDIPICNMTSGAVYFQCCEIAIGSFFKAVESMHIWTEYLLIIFCVSVVAIVVSSAVFCDKEIIRKIRR